VLEIMRKHAKFFYFLFVIVIISFVFWGVGTVDKSTSVGLAEIGDQKISVEEYWRTYERIRNIYRESAKGQLPEDFEKKLKLKELVLNNLVEDKVLMISAKQMGITVTDDELQNAITSDPNFMRDGVFRKDIYFRTLDLNRITPEFFEASMRQQLIIGKIKGLIESVVDLGPSDIRDLPADKQKAEEIVKAALESKRAAALKSFVEAAKQKMNVKIKMELIS
jgi:peptidyl-prolyl cis-trans isomerase D